MGLLGFFAVLPFWLMPLLYSFYGMLPHQPFIILGTVSVVSTVSIGLYGIRLLYSSDFAKRQSIILSSEVLKIE